MDFAALPPEVISGRMYAGPGAGSLATAATGWDRLAIELRSAADAYQSVISGLSSRWLGPSAAAMAAAATPYAAWLRATAAHAELTAGQARDAVTAYDTAMSTIVDPVEIAANRTQLATLLATDIVGQNAAPIAAIEAQYAEMWARDAAAMHVYSAQSAAAARLPAFTQAPRTSDGSPVPAAAGPTATGTTTSMFAPGSPLSTLLEAYEFGGPSLLPARNALASSTVGMGLTARAFQTGQLPVTTAPLAAGLSAGNVASPVDAQPGVLASAGRAASVGRLSVPPSWAAATPTIRLAAAAIRGVPGAAVMVTNGGNIFGAMGAAGVVGAMGAAAPRVAVTGDVAGVPTGTDEDVAARDRGANKDKLTRVLAELSEQPESVQHWHTDKAQLDDLLEQLSSKPGVHAVHVSRGKANRNRPRWG